VQTVSLIIIFVIMTVIRIWFDLAEADTVLTDERAVRRSVRTAFRQTKRNLGSLVASYVAISIVGVVILAVGIVLWDALVPPASVLGAFVTGQLILLLLLAIRFWQRATAVSSYLRGVSEEPAEIQPMQTMVLQPQSFPPAGFDR
jgi:membrane-anchored glycerophosphoryl diester phosphodiesterase (GDPDase)